MGTAIYGSYDELVLELSMTDRLRNGLAPRTVRVKLDDVVHARPADPADLVSFAGERVLRVGRIRQGRRVVVLDLATADGGPDVDRILVAVHDPDAAVAGLHRSGIGRSGRRGATVVAA
jgi:hypothetical protein